MFKPNRPLFRFILLPLILLLQTAWLYQPVLAKGSDTVSGAVLLERGKARLQEGDMAGAARFLSAALASAPSEGPESLRIRSLLATAHEQRGYLRKARNILMDGLPLPDPPRHPGLEAAYLSQTGNLLLSLGESEKSRRFLERAENRAAAAGDEVVLAGVLNHMGSAHALAGDREGALSAFRNGIDLLRAKTGTAARHVRVRLLINLARYHLQDADEAAARQAVASALSDLRDRDRDHATGTALVSAGMLSLEIARSGGIPASEDFRAAFFAFREALEIGREIDHPALAASAAGHLGAIYGEAEQPEEAMALTREAIFLAHEGRVPAQRYRWEWQLGRLHDGRGNSRAALAFLNRAVETLTPIRGNLMQDRRRRGEIFHEQIRPVYLDLARVLVTAAADLPRGGERQGRLSAAREVMETLKNAELENFFQDPCVAAEARQWQRLDQSPTGAAVIYPIVFEDRIALLLTLSDGMRLSTIPVDAARLDRAVRRFRRLLQSPGTGQRYFYYARRLYDWLIAPIADDLRSDGIRTLVVAPDGVLRLIPFAALHDGERFLTQTFGVVTTPGLTLTAPADERPMAPRPLLAGLSEARQGFRPLPAVPRELHAIQSLLGGKVLLDEAYTLDNLEAAFDRTGYNLIHLATHGEFGGSGDTTFLLTSEGRLSMDRLARLIDKGRFRENRVELLTLSACQTALGDVRSALGLGGVAVKAGARAAVATLWSVDDEATSLWVRSFYEAFRQPGMEKAEALRQAQARLISDEAFGHPAYWAPFLLIGNWR